MAGARPVVTVVVKARRGKGPRTKRKVRELRARREEELTMDQVTAR
jgi:hypothetical protein